METLKGIVATTVLYICLIYITYFVLWCIFPTLKITIGQVISVSLIYTLVMQFISWALKGYIRRLEKEEE